MISAIPKQVFRIFGCAEYFLFKTLLFGLGWTIVLSKSFSNSEIVLLVVIHSPYEIISTMGKTGQDAWRKRKPCRKVFIHISNKSASNKLKKCINGIFKASLFEWNFVLFKILQTENIPALHCKRAYSRREWAWAMWPRSNQLRLMLKTGKTLNTYRTAVSPTLDLLCHEDFNVGRSEAEIQQIIYVHRFAGRVSTYFSVSFRYKYG